MKSRMGRATESHFAVLNTKIIERKQTSRSFDPAKVLNPALRSIVRNEEDNKGDFLKAKLLFMGEEARNRLNAPKASSFTAQADSIEPAKEEDDSKSPIPNHEAETAYQRNRR